MTDGEPMLKIFALTIFLMAISGCRVSNEPLPTNSISCTLVQEGTEIGSAIKISGVDTTLDLFHYQIRFPGTSARQYARKFDAAMAVFNIPFGAKSGNLEFFVDDEPITIKNFIVTEDSPENQVLVKWYNLSDSITRQSSVTYSFDGPISWQGELENDTLVISKEGLCGDECNFQYNLKLQLSGPGELPAFISFRHDKSDYFQEQENYIINSGLIKLQQFNSSGICSGKIYYAGDEPEELTFCVDLGNK